MGGGIGRDDGAERMAPEPVGERGAYHALATPCAAPVPCNHENGPQPPLMGAQQEAGQDVLGLEPAMAVQVQARLDRVALAR